MMMIPTSTISMTIEYSNGESLSKIERDFVAMPLAALIEGHSRGLPSPKGI
jgi:hypothetical protein